MTANPFDLTGRLAVVTGARRGIGAAIATGLAAAGADVIGISVAMEPTGSDVERAVRDAGREFHAIRADLGDRDETADAGQRVLQIGVPDILVNNAGTIARAPAAEHPLDWWDHVLAVDLTGPFQLTQLLGLPMLERGSGKVVFTASLLSFQGGVTVPGYAAAKHGVAGITKALANEWAGRGVNVNAVAPGYIATDNTQALRDDPARFASITERIPAGRWGSAADVAGACVFLCTAAADYVHGTVLAVDGGWLGR